MRTDPVPQLSPDQLQTVDNVLADTPTPGQTRRSILKRAAVGAVSLSAVGGLAGALAPRASAQTNDSVVAVGRAAVTAEALAVTFLTRAVHAIHHGQGVKPLRDAEQILRAANREETQHYRVLHKAGFEPLTLKFWLPDGLLGDKLQNVAATGEAAETLFVNAYLIGVTTFAEAGNPTLARYAGEILGTEAEHRALFRFVQGKLPNNKAFESYSIHAIGGIVGALEGFGIGFGKEGKKPGHFWDYDGPGNARIPVSSLQPE